ncbi:MAG: hypothetical protein CL849_04730 [Crocinitomicaceae bacterium]|nr:hypothetical protein [Crocinitomicaceae bacterium]
MSTHSINELDQSERIAGLEAKVRELQEANARYEDIMSNMALGILEVDIDEKILRANPKFCQIVGHTESELLGKRASDVLLEGTELDRMNRRRQERSDGKSGTYELSIRTKQGATRWLMISAVPLQDSTGKVIGSMGIHQDITDRKNVEEELRSSKDIAEAAQRSEREFLTRMSHEIRTPMNAIMGMADLLGETHLDSVQQNLLSAIEGGGTVLKQLLDDVLDLAKLEAGQRQCRPASVELDSLFRRIVSMFRPALSDKGVEVRVELDPSTGSTWKVDAAIVTQVLMNALGNAVKFTDKGRITLGAMVTGEINGQAHLEIVVKDTGVGIRKDELAHVFERFHQATNREVRHGGTGLGLAIVKELCMLHGGDATVESRLGEGSVFRFTFAVEQGTRSSTVSGRLDDTDWAGKRVLVAEDNPVNRFFIDSLLRMWNVNVQCVENGREALDAMVSSPFDLVFMDIQMPEMDGLEATRQYRLWEDKAPRLRMPIVALSAFAFDHDRREALASGMDAHVSKPFTREELKAVCNRFMVSVL